LKVLTVNYEFPPQGGGAGVVMLNLVNALHTASSVDQTLLCGWDFRLGAAPVLPGVTLKLIPLARKNLHQTGVRAIGEFLARAAVAIRRLDPRSYDLIHFHFSIPTGLLAAAAHRKPYVCSLHGIDVPDFVHEEGRVFRHLLGPANRCVLGHAARLFAPSRQIAKLVNRFCPRAQVDVIPHGVEAQAFVPKRQYPAVARRFVTIARLAPWKRVYRLVQAVIELRKSYPDVRLDVFGDGTDGPRIAGLVRSAGAMEHITLHGIAPQETLQADLQTYDAFVLPSISEAFGVVFLEAMAAGLPVVGFNYGGPADIVTPGENGLLVDRDALPDLVQALGQLAGVSGMVEKMGRNARAAAVARFSWGAVAGRYADGYDMALSRSVR